MRIEWTLIPGLTVSSRGEKSPAAAMHGTSIIRIGSTRRTPKMLASCSRERYDVRRRAPALTDVGGRGHEKGHECTEVEGLADDAVDDIGIERRMLTLRKRGQNDDRGPRVAPPKLPNQVEPVHPRHREVEDDQVVSRVLQLLHRLDAVRGDVRFDAGARCDHGQERPDRAIVINDEDSGCHRNLCECHASSMQTTVWKNENPPRQLGPERLR